MRYQFTWVDICAVGLASSELPASRLRMPHARSLARARARARAQTLTYALMQTARATPTNPSPRTLLRAKPPTGIGALRPVLACWAYPTSAPSPDPACASLRMATWPGGGRMVRSTAELRSLPSSTIAWLRGYARAAGPSPLLAFETALDTRSNEVRAGGGTRSGGGQKGDKQEL